MISSKGHILQRLYFLSWFQSFNVLIAQRGIFRTYDIIIPGVIGGVGD